MIVVKIELWPFGEGILSEEIGRLEISNLTGGDVSDYAVAGHIAGDEGAGAPGFEFETAVEKHARKDGALSLLFKAIAASPAAQASKREYLDALLNAMDPSTFHGPDD
ncbi:hypothetical protein M527_16015 [Sphingobium indicum IP26]|uniref:Uncharacterized protein n=1 Tax=Sphingobium indicum F2 TaxID=1450518 RepID=A0A8E0WUD5_9SPHN|nr:hypothetical protein [Sphingobium indicum]EPR17565.1 hypothetical protein M527_16015 [Sphingobium indicum IP26]KER37638.1 hypothetical protein AL00_04305 [Sphingobium indicum F2]